MRLGGAGATVSVRGPRAGRSQPLRPWRGLWWETWLTRPPERLGRGVFVGSSSGAALLLQGAGGIAAGEGGRAGERRGGAGLGIREGRGGAGEGHERVRGGMGRVNGETGRGRGGTGRDLGWFRLQGLGGVLV